ncbi:MAG: glycosyltransferase [Limnoraphis sp. WC205]|jgi:glycosyltransferase involved in cell wall biosynthesis|nr:glycosyltransferase [Limnoraphis sp. WC205]
MGQGNYERLRQYFHNPNVNKPLEEIYADLDAYSYEIFENQPERFNTISFFVVLPPVRYEGRLIKGFYLSESVDLLNKVLPQLSEYFFAHAYSMYAAFPWSNTADSYSSLYDNPHRNAWFCKTYPERAKKILISCYDSDFINEYVIAPKPVVQKDIDLLCVSRLSAEKNIPMIAKALKIYHQKYGKKIKMTLIPGFQNFQGIDKLDSHARHEWQQIEAILGDPFEYIDLVPRAEYYKEMPVYYSRSKVCVLGSLLEGKNRFLSEAMSCNVPVICFQEFNQYVRGQDGAFPEGAGLYAKFEPESLADTIHTVLEHPTAFKPRLAYLKHRGRKNFMNTCLDSYSYYQENVPDYLSEQAFNNLWLDLAVQQNYQMSLSDFLYGRSDKSHIRGLVSIYKILNQWLNF